MIPRLLDIIDIETTGLNPDIDMICEIGVVRLDTVTGVKKDVYEKIVNDKFRLLSVSRDSWIFNNSSLTYDDVCNASSIQECSYELQSILKSKTCKTAYNWKFDFGFLKKMGFHIRNDWCVDVMDIMTPVLMLPHPYYIYKYPKVGELYRWLFNVPYVEKHRALQDARDEASIIYECIKRGYLY